MTHLDFADPLQATSICNNYNHVVQILLLRISEARGLQAGSYGENHTSYGEYRSGSSKPMVEIILHGGEYTVIGDVRTVLINRCVNEPIWG
jgi:hypothetical protein